MTIQVDLNPELEAHLSAAARERGIAVEHYAQLLLQQAVATDRSLHPRATREEFRAFLDSLATSTANAPHLDTETFSREMIYGEHD